MAQRLRNALARLNPDLPAQVLEDAFRKLTRPEGADLIQRNRAVHRMLVDGVMVEYRDAEGGIRRAQARVLDFDGPENNDWLAVNQFTVVENRHTRRPDVVLFVNGLPLAIIELKNPADKQATLWNVYQQLQTYKQGFPALFAYNEALAISDGLDARIGTLTADRDRFMPWRTVGGDNASFIGFTGTPIERADKNTRAVFGNPISIYDIQRAVEDKATVPIHYASRPCQTRP